MSKFQIKDVDEKSLETYIKAYMFSGKQDFKDENGYPMKELDEDVQLLEVLNNQDICAVEYCDGNSTKYFVKRGKHGHLFNPIGLYAEGTEYKQSRHQGKPLWKLSRAEKKVFEYYINFLKTKNPAWLNNAEREV